MRQRFQLDAIAATPWKNGGGSTRELACWPPAAGLEDFGWRISVATIARGGPFSAFPGVDRCILLLEGGGVQLRSATSAMAHRLDEPLRPFFFSGNESLECELVAQTSVDFNVMTRRDRWRAEVQVLHHAAALPAAAHGLLLAFRGDWRLRRPRQESLACPAHQGWWWAGESAAALEAEPLGDPAPVLIAVRFFEVQP